MHTFQLVVRQSRKFEADAVTNVLTPRPAYASHQYIFLRGHETSSLVLAASSPCHTQNKRRLSITCNW